MQEHSELVEIGVDKFAVYSVFVGANVVQVVRGVQED